jgi:hypothetical protein
VSPRGTRTTGVMGEAMLGLALALELAGLGDDVDDGVGIERKEGIPVLVFGERSVGSWVAFRITVTGKSQYE